MDCDDSDPQAGYCPGSLPAATLTVTATGDSAACPDGSGQLRLYAALRDYRGERDGRRHDDRLQQGE
ncbi:MAG: hypothetical protein U0232_20810 [Thermomicrobiales bacterium]